MVEQFFNDERESDFLDSSNASIGLSNIKVNVQNGILTCSFSRENKIDVPNYFKISESTDSFLIAAYGSLCKNFFMSFYILNFFHFGFYFI